jgi:hypothetical protein
MNRVESNMDIYTILQYAFKEVKNGNVLLHKYFLSEILDVIIRKDIYELRLMEENAYNLSEKEYYSHIVRCMETLVTGTDLRSCEAAPRRELCSRASPGHR